MQISPGESLGPCKIISPIGEGGMCEVWKARDTRLDRVVAIKHLKGGYGVCAPRKIVPEMASQRERVTQAEIENLSAKYDYQTQNAALQYSAGQLP